MTEAPPAKRRPGRPPDVDGEDTRREAITSARRLFGELGYHATTTRQIALDVGVTPAALFHHFGRKKELALAVYWSTTADEYSHVRAGVDAAPTFVAKLQALVEEVRRSVRQDPHLSRFMSVIRDEARRNDDLSEILKDTRFTDIIREVVEFGVTTSAIRREDAVLWRGVISAFWPGIVAQSPELSPRQLDAMIEGCKRLFAKQL